MSINGYRTAPEMAELLGYRRTFNDMWVHADNERDVLLPTDDGHWHRIVEGTSDLSARSLRDLLLDIEEARP